jgi:DNA polymerase III alpha subunit (gram-positive type)
MPRYFLFDLETTGLPLNFKLPYTYVENWPRIVQFSWLVADHTGKGGDIQDFIIKPDGFVVPRESSDVHGITHEMAVKEGIDLKEVLDKFMADAKTCDHIVAHNLQFDRNVLCSELYRMGDTKLCDWVVGVKGICTKDETTEWCKLRPFRYGTWKWPKLSELHYILFNEHIDPVKAHNSKYDVEILSRCFFNLLDRGLILSSHVRTLRNGKCFVKC